MLSTPAPVPVHALPRAFQLWDPVQGTEAGIPGGVCAQSHPDPLRGVILHCQARGKRSLRGNYLTGVPQNDRIV